VAVSGPFAFNCIVQYCMLICQSVVQAYFGLMLIDADRNSAATKSNATLKEPKPNMERRPSAQFKPVCSYTVFMAALRSRCGYSMLPLWLLLSFFVFFSSPILSGRRLDVYHTSAHDAALVRI